jgi:hypothetical protein
MNLSCSLLAEAHRAHAELMRKQREVEEQKREIELTVEKRVSEAIGAVRSKARQEVEGELKLKVTEKDQVIQSMQRQIDIAEFRGKTPQIAMRPSDVERESSVREVSDCVSSGIDSAELWKYFAGAIDEKIECAGEGHVSASIPLQTKITVD